MNFLMKDVELDWYEYYVVNLYDIYLQRDETTKKLFETDTPFLIQLNQIDYSLYYKKKCYFTTDIIEAITMWMILIKNNDYYLKYKGDAVYCFQIFEKIILSFNTEDNYQILLNQLKEKHKQMKLNDLEDYLDQLNKKKNTGTISQFKETINTAKETKMAVNESMELFSLNNENDKKNIENLNETDNVYVSKMDKDLISNIFTKNSTSDFVNLIEKKNAYNVDETIKPINPVYVIETDDKQENIKSDSDIILDLFK